MATIILHIVFKDQYHLYETENPFGSRKKDLNKNKLSNSNLTNLNEDINGLNTFYQENKILRIETSPSALNLLSNKANTEMGMYQNTVTNFNPTPATKQKEINFDNQKYVFIKVKDRHQYDLNPKLIKFFIAEMLKDERNRVKLFNINKKLDNLVKDKVIKFGLQQYFNVMDEVVSMLETTVHLEEENIRLYDKELRTQKQSEEQKVRFKESNFVKLQISLKPKYQCLNLQNNNQNII